MAKTQKQHPVKKVPMRMCVGCHEMKPKKDLIRAVKNNSGEISLDSTGKKPGRGAYLCNSTECFSKAKKNKKFERAFKSAISAEIYDMLEQQIGNC